jgi:uncharacterized protein involved in outer membrane biogenesis
LSSRIKTSIYLALAAFLALIVAIGAGVVPLNLFFLKSAVTDAVRERTGAELVIEGPLKLRLGPRPAVTASGIGVRLPSDPGRELIALDRLLIQPKLLDVLDGEMHFRRIEIAGFRLNYCPVLPDVQRAGDQADSDNPLGGLPSIGVNTLVVEQARLHCDDPGRRLAQLPEELEVHASAPLNGPLNVEVGGRFDDDVVELTFIGESLGKLLAGAAEYAAELNVEAAGTRLAAEGSVGNPWIDPDFEGRIDFESGNLSGLLERLGLEPLNIGSVKVGGAVTADAGSLTVDNAEGMLEEHSFALSGRISNTGARPDIELDLHLPILDLDRLPMAGADASKASVADPEASSAGSVVAADLGPVFEALAQFDARADVSIDRVLNAPWPVEKVSLGGDLDRSLLSVQKAAMKLAGSPVELQAGLDLRQACPRLTAELDIGDLELTAIGQVVEQATELGGRLGHATARTESCGNSLDEHLRSLATRIAVADLRTTWAATASPVHFTTGEARFGRTETGSLAFDATLLDRPLSVEIAFGSIDGLLSGSEWPVAIVATGSESRLTLNGSAALAKEGVKADATLEVDISRFGALHNWVGANPDSTVAVDGRARLSLDRDALVLEDLAVTAGRSHLRGAIRLPNPETDLPMLVDLHSERLDVSELVALFPEAPEQPSAERQAAEEILREVDWIDQWSRIPEIDLDYRVAEVEGIHHEVSDLELRGRLRDRLIEDSRLEFLFHGMMVEGRVQVDFRDVPWTARYRVNLAEVDIGRLLAEFDVTEDVKARFEHLEVSVHSEGESLAQLAANIYMEARIASLHWILQGEDTARSYEFLLSEIEATSTPEQPIDWRTSGELNGVPIRAWMQTPGLSELLDTPNHLPLRLVFSARDDITMLDLVLDRRKSGRLDAELSLSGLRQELQGVDFSTLESPLADYHLHSVLALERDRLDVARLEAKAGTSQIEGTGRITRAQHRFQADIALRSPFLETDDLVQFATELRQYRQALVGEGSIDSELTPAEAKLFETIDGYIAELTDSYTIDLQLDIDELRSAETLLGDAHMTAHADDYEVLLDPVQINLPGGDIRAYYRGREVEGGADYVLDVDIERFSYGGILRLLNPESEAAGEMFLDLDLSSRSASAKYAVNNLTGYADLVVFPEGAQAGFLDLWASNLVFALLPGDDSHKKMNCMVARFDVEDGVMRTKNTFLDSTDIIVRARGNIDLANRELDLTVAPQAKREKFLSVSTPLTVTGPFDDFDIDVAPGGFVTTMLRWFYGLIYVPWKWLTGDRFPADGTETCYRAMDWPYPE